MLAALAAIALLVFGAAQMASAGPVAPQGSPTIEQPPLSPAAQEQAKLAGAPTAQLTPQLVFAVVDNGTLTGQNFGASGAARVGVGTYEVFFGASDITGGAYTASIGIPGSVGASPSGEVTVVGRVGTTNGLFIQTYDSAGALADRSFHLHVAF
ncbi:hypothetical protein FHS29_006894 [Saccharothrix tamanrassetensis]|uniref:Allene oxide cyclase barrel-like domain-containing protein n=1 Tax=Saccharothrix tamanrassetensis TaxID=1051531 RepID=A0A841CRB9_9PSEU|nr:hypothetical protein [Saccharothrix tamanrassetensis]MBB5960271.1 hypothetical protein [Saccharothrix tamanrassetensis]